MRLDQHKTFTGHWRYEHNNGRRTLTHKRTITGYMTLVLVRSLILPDALHFNIVADIHNILASATDIRVENGQSSHPQQHSSVCRGFISLLIQSTMVKICLKPMWSFNCREKPHFNIKLFSQFGNLFLRLFIFITRGPYWAKKIVTYSKPPQRV